MAKRGVVITSDAFLQMPKGVLVATVAIQNATNVGVLAIRILGSTDSNLQEK